MTEPDLTSELDDAEAVVIGGATVKTEWASRDSSGKLFVYGHDEFIARSVVASRERRGLHDVLVHRTVTCSPWEEVPGDIAEAEVAKAAEVS